MYAQITLIPEQDVCSIPQFDTLKLVMRSFNLSGSCNSNVVYMVLVSTAIKNLVKGSYLVYLTIYSGKRLFFLENLPVELL